MSSVHVQSDSESDMTCWICYGSQGPMISPCDCRGSMQWVHSDCLHTWVTTRAVSAANHDQNEGNAASLSDRFKCPNCGAAYVLEHARGHSDSQRDDIWPDWWPWPRHFESLDREVASSFRWKLIQPALCIAVHAVLLLVTAWYVKEFWRDVGENGYGELLSLKEVTARQLRDQPILSFVLTLAFGEDIVEHPVRMDIELGHISKIWSMTFAAIQRFHGTTMMFSFFLFLSGGYEWISAEDIWPLPPWIRHRDAAFFVFCVNPPVLRFVRVLAINFVVPITRAVYPDVQGHILWVVYDFFPSWVDVGLHSATATMFIWFYIHAMCREYSIVKEQLRTIWRIHSVGDLVIQDRSALVQRATAQEDSSAATSE